MNNFVKYNYKQNDTFIKEAHDLTLLAQHLDATYIKIPSIVHVCNEKLELQRIIIKKPTPQLMSTLGKGLAKLHEQPFCQYGFEEDNFIGLNIQKNGLSNNWGEFFYKNRLLFQVQMLKPLSLKKRFENILLTNAHNVISFLNNSCKHPSLLHGDLWSGNVLFDDTSVWFIDPSCYYGDREVDIAMSELFLGFSKEFYNAYNETYGLSCEYEQKKVIYNLYHNLNHYNLFGNSYLEECEKAFAFIETL